MGARQTGCLGVPRARRVKPGAFYRRVITTVREPTFPAASVALMVTAFIPNSNGTVADQLAVPMAVPALPKFVAHVTALTPMLSLAVPRSVNSELDVA